MAPFKKAPFGKREINGELAPWCSTATMTNSTDGRKKKKTEYIDYKSPGRLRITANSPCLKTLIQ